MKLKTNDLAICAELSHCMVREYSDQGLLGPISRLENSNYRSFDPRQIPHLYLFKALRDIGFGPQQLKEFAQNRSPETAQELFGRCSAQLVNEIHLLQARLLIFQSYVALMSESADIAPNEIKRCTLPEQTVRLSSLVNFGGKVKDLERLHRAHGYIRQQGNPGCPLGYAYQNFYDLLDHPERPAQLVSYDPQGTDVQPAGEYLVGAGVCCYGEEAALGNRMLEYALANDLEFNGPVYTVYLLDAACVSDVQRYLMRISAAIRPMQGGRS